MITFLASFIFTILVFIGYNIYKSEKMIRKYRNSSPPPTDDQMKRIYEDIMNPVIRVDFKNKKRTDLAGFSVPVKKGIKKTTYN